MFLQTTETLLPWSVVMHGQCFLNTHTHTVHYESQPIPPQPVRICATQQPLPSLTRKKHDAPYEHGLMSETEKQAESSRCPWCWFSCWEHRRPTQSCLSIHFSSLSPALRGGRIGAKQSKIKRTKKLFQTLVFICWIKQQQRHVWTFEHKFKLWTWPPRLLFLSLTHEHSICHILAVKCCSIVAWCTGLL